MNGRNCNAQYSGCRNGGQEFQVKEPTVTDAHVKSFNCEIFIDSNKVNERITYILLVLNTILI